MSVATRRSKGDFWGRYFGELGKTFPSLSVPGPFQPVVLLLGGEYQPVHSGVETGVIAGLAVGAHIQGAIELISVALQGLGQIAIFDVMATYGCLCFVLTAHISKYRQQLGQAELLPPTAKVGNYLHIPGYC